MTSPVMMSFMPGNGDCSSDCLFFLTFDESSLRLILEGPANLEGEFDGATRGRSSGLDAPDNLETLGTKKDSLMELLDITGNAEGFNSLEIVLEAEMSCFPNSEGPLLCCFGVFCVVPASKVEALVV